jgi:UDP-N-acetylmuramoyl-L-alanyl-D-glutamate--2,6-diaminopimelate ligase
MMQIEKLFKDIDHKVLSGDPLVSISGINIDSRLVKEGDLFVAILGRNSDGHDFVEKVIAQGAAAVLIQIGSKDNLMQSAKVPIIAVADTRAVLSKLVNNFRGNPSKKFNLIGITGTNGKTSTAAMIDHILRTEGHKTGLLGTIENYCGGEIIETKRTTPTTPDCIELGEIMTLMADNDVDDLIMEVSSMGLKTGRVTACDIDIGVFTNLSPEHLDDHGTMDDYKESKLLLFGIADKAVINADENVAGEVIAKAMAGEKANTKREILLFGLKDNIKPDLPYFNHVGEESPRLTVLASDIEYTDGGVSFTATYTDAKGEVSVSGISLVTPSEFAVYNALAAMGAAILSGIAPEAAAKALSSMGGVPGRYEVITSDGGITAIIDYAHTAEALERLLEAVRAVPAYKRILSVFGCGGDRDPSKRAPMGEISAKLADYSVITSDNPRTEDPEAIIAQIEEGMISVGLTMPADYEIIPDRRAAIELAASITDRGDVIVIAGKGHEDYQIIGTEKIHFDDREEIRAAFAALGKQQ